MYYNYFMCIMLFVNVSTHINYIYYIHDVIFTFSHKRLVFVLVHVSLSACLRQ